MLSIGDKVAYGNSWGKGWTVSTVERLTPKRAVLANGDQVHQEGCLVIGKGFIAKPYEEVSEEIEDWRTQEAIKRDLSKQKSRVHSGYDLMARGQFAGFTAEDLRVVADAMEVAIAARRDRKTLEG